MRIWSLHPRYLDAQGLVALWREALLAQKVLAGGTRGYRHHPQLRRFRLLADPSGAISAYLHGVAAEAGVRGYRFDLARIGAEPVPAPMNVTTGQLGFEWDHLRRKLRLRSPDVADRLSGVTHPDPHPLFTVVQGEIAEWERRS